MAILIPIGLIMVSSVVLLISFGGTVGGTIDIPSLFVMLVTVFEGLAAGGLVRDFFRGLKISASKKNFSALETANSLAAVNLVMRMVLVSALATTFLCLAMLLSIWDDKGAWGKVLALGLITLLYSAETEIVLVCVRAKIQKKLAAFKTSVSGEKSVEISKIPLLPVISFLAGGIALFLLLSIGRTFVLADFMPGTLGKLPLMLVLLILGSYILMIPSRSLIPFFRALKFAVLPKTEETPARFSQGRKAVFQAIFLRTALSFFGAVILAVCALNSVENPDEAAHAFSIPLILLFAPFLSAIFLLPISARIEKAMNSKLY